MIYDCFTFFNELDLLEIRLEELNSVVDKFVIIEAKQTHSGLKKELNFLKEKNRFAKYLNKIIYISVDLSNSPDFRNLPGYVQRDYLDKNPSVWSREIYQRNCITMGLKNANPDDIILISDIDEIPSAKSFKKITPTRLKNKILSFEQNLFYYYFNYITDQKWYGTKAVLFNNLNSPEEIRMSPNNYIIKNGGWHFSFLGGVEKISEKIGSFSHQEFNTKEINNKIHIKFCIDNCLDIFDRPIKFKVLKNLKILPAGIIENKNKFNKYFKKGHALKQFNNRSITSLHDENIFQILNNTYPSSQGEDKQTYNLGFGYIYYSLARVFKPINVVVFGSAKGFSPVCFGLGIKDNRNGGTLSFVDAGYSIYKDPKEKSMGGFGFWKSKKNIDNLIRKFGLKDVFIPFIMKTSQFFKQYNQKPIDILYIDADHSYEGFKYDFEHFSRYVKDDGIIVFHDVLVDNGTFGYNFGVKKYYNKILSKNRKFSSIVIPIWPGLCICFKKSNTNIFNKIYKKLKI